MQKFDFSNEDLIVDEKLIIVSDLFEYTTIFYENPLESIL